VTVLFAVDLSEPQSIVRWTEQFAEQLNAELLVLHVDVPVDELTNPPVEPFSGIGIFDPYQMYDPSTRKEIESSREHAFQDFVHQQFSGPVRPALRQGDPADTIIQDAQKEDVDLIILGKRRHPMLERLLIGSVARTVVENTDIPTVLVPIPEEQEDSDEASV
jgi:nucleotide-binding universal stress UspA family protein